MYDKQCGNVHRQCTYYLRAHLNTITEVDKSVISLISITCLLSVRLRKTDEFGARVQSKFPSPWMDSKMAYANLCRLMTTKKKFVIVWEML